MSSLDQVWAAFDQIRSERNCWAHGQPTLPESSNAETANELVSQLRTCFNGRGRFYSSFGLEYLSPRNVADFCSAIVEKFRPKTILDPTCGYGILLAAASQAASPNVIHGVDANLQATQVASAIAGSDSTIIHGDIFAGSSELLDHYDLIISDPPLNTPIRDEKGREGWARFKNLDLAANLMIWASSRLSESGHALFVVAPSFFYTSKRKQVLKSLAANGCRITAAIHIPGGTRSNTSISTYLVLIERGLQEDVFIGSLKPDAASQSFLLTNLVRRKPKGEAALGRLCPLEEFSGFERFVAKENLLRLVREFGWVSHDATQIFTEAELLKPRSQDFNLEASSNSLYLKLVGKGTASLQLDDLGQSLNEVLHLKVNLAVADPAFLVHWVNESRIGRLSLETLRDGTTIPRIRAKELLASTFYLPPIEEQKLIVEGASYLRKIRADADELESALISGTEPTGDIVSKIYRINQEDRYEDWLETLPFPLASILWRHHASKDSYRQRYEVLLHFFEATAAFVATIHLSAFMSDVSLWEELGSGLTKKLSEQRLSLRQATFGSWKLVAEKLGGDCSSILKKAERNSEQDEIWRRIYCTSDRRIVEMLSASRLLSILQQANKIRNDWHGHTGAIGEDTAKMIHDQLFDLVQQVRGLFGGNWLRYELIQPDSSRYKNGLHQVTCKRLMGTRNAPFQEKLYASSGPLEAESLYLFDSVSQTGLLLRPFIEVMQSPERRAMACFIYNRLDKDSARWVSYHCEQESEITHTQPGVQEALLMLDRFQPERN